jgi:small GTP-binding protein
MATAMSLIKNTTINSEEKELHQELEAQSTDILAKISDPEYQLSVLIIGASQTGKTSLVANMFGTEASDSLEKLGIIIGKDGSPTTQDVRSVFLPELKLNLIDTPGLEKDRRVNRARQIVSEIRSKKLEPNVIWLVVNLQGSIEEVELELVKSFPNAPVLLILNKVDILQNHKTELNTDSRCLEQFDQLSKPELPQWMQKYNKLMAVRERLFNWQKNHVSIRRVLITSMKQEGDDDDNPIGLDEVYAATWSCLDTVGRITLTNTQQKSKRGKLALSVSTVLTAAAAAGGEDREI